MPRLSAGGRRLIEPPPTNDLVSTSWPHYLYPLCINLVCVWQMAGGNLEEAILGRNRSTPLDWRIRLRILRDASRGLLYLHTRNGLKDVVFHKDVKPANILLNGQFDAKLSDVGLAAPMWQHQESSLDIRGTPGYLEPEYEQTGVFDALTE